MRVRAAIRGFSLTELLVVVAVILILISVLIVGVQQIYASAMCLKCQHRMEQVWHGCLMYSNANHGPLPMAWDHQQSKPWYEVLHDDGYVDDEAVIGCPSSDIEVVRGTSGYAPGTSTEAYEQVSKVLNWINNPANQTAHTDSGGAQWLGGCTKGQKPGATGFAALAFLGSGYNINHSTYGGSLKKALRFLMWCSDTHNGNIAEFDTESYSYRRSYNQGVSTMALCDAYRMMGDVSIGGRSLKSTAQKAINYLMSTQHATYGGFPYTSTYSDNSANSWAWQGVCSARSAGLLDAALAANGITNFDSRTSEYHWRCIETDGSGVYQATAMPTSTSVKSQHRMTPATLAVRLLSGLDRDDPSVALQMTYLKTSDVDGLPYTRWGDGTKFDLYVTYYVTLALFQLGGDEWETWVGMFVDDMVGRATPGATADEAYYSTNKAVYGAYGGCIYPTAIAAMSLQMACCNLLPGSKWYEPGSHSFGYNEALGQDLRTPAPDTIVLMDYMQSAVTSHDSMSCVAARHGGKVNVLLADGHVEALYPEEFMDAATGKIQAGRLTVERDD